MKHGRNLTLISHSGIADSPCGEVETTLVDPAEEYDERVPFVKNDENKHTKLIVELGFMINPVVFLYK